MHVHKKRRELIPSFFSHAFSAGLSIQRIDRAQPQELNDWVSNFLRPKDDRAWLGYVSARTQNLRSIIAEDSKQQMFCVYDTSRVDNPAHAEISISIDKPIPEADLPELRAKLMKAFDNGTMHNRLKLLDGKVFGMLPLDLQQRSTPSQWI
jgi:hypothetical protein